MGTSVISHFSPILYPEKNRAIAGIIKPRNFNTSSGSNPVVIILIVIYYNSLKGKKTPNLGRPWEKY
jgi:hypothetical protein